MWLSINTKTIHTKIAWGTNMAEDLYSAQILKDTLVRIKDPKNGVKLSTKILDPKKKKKLVFVQGFFEHN